MGIRLTIIWIWRLIDPIFYLFSRLHYIKDHQKNSSIFRVRITKYKGKNIFLSDGTAINKNDMLIKIHLHNVRLIFKFFYIKNDLKRARLIHRFVKNSMPVLAEYLMNHPEEEKIKGIIGITTLDRGVSSLGFECFIPTNRYYRLFKKLGQLPILLLSNTSIKTIQKHELNYLLISKEKLYTQYGYSPASK